MSEEASGHRQVFAALLEPANVERKRRVDERCGDRGPRIRGPINAEVLKEMLDEPSWSPAWKEIAVADNSAKALARNARRNSALPTGTYQIAT